MHYLLLLLSEIKAYFHFLIQITSLPMIATRSVILPAMGHHGTSRRLHLNGTILVLT